jgi:hypothetical protein
MLDLTIYETPLYRRELGDGREIAVYLRLFNSILQIGPSGAAWYETHW